MERTVIFSLIPGMPTFRQQIPRTIRSIFTPAADARYSAAMISRSHREFIFATICAFSPFFAFSSSIAIRCRNRSRIHSGATTSLFHLSGSE